MERNINAKSFLYYEVTTAIKDYNIHYSVEDVIDKDYAEKFYPTGDFHNIYICEIEKIYAR